MEFRDVYPLLTSFYDKAKNSPHVKNPLAWALYQVWKMSDADMVTTIKPDGVHELDTCNFEEVGVYKNVTVQILRCKDCGRISIGWLRQDNTEEVYDSEQSFRED